MNFSEHKDNLNMNHLERQDKKTVIKNLINIEENKWSMNNHNERSDNNNKRIAIENIVFNNTKELQLTYHEVLESLRPDQIASLIKKNYFNKKTNSFLPYSNIYKDYAYNFLVQTALAMLWKNIVIDADNWPKTKATVIAFQKEHRLNVDWQVWPAVLERFAALLSGDTTTPASRETINTTPIATIKPKEFHSNYVKWPLSYEEYKDASDKQREKACFESLVQLWYSPAISAGILWNAYVESFDWNGTKRHYHTTSYGDWWKSFWLFQLNNFWPDKKNWRLNTYKRFAQSLWTPIDAYDTQLAFVKYELETHKMLWWEQLAVANSPEEAAKIFMTKFERPKNKRTLTKRQKKAKEIFEEYGWWVA